MTQARAGACSTCVAAPASSCLIRRTATPSTWARADCGAGRTWTLVHPVPETLKGAVMPDDHAGFRLLSGAEPRGQATALAIDPVDSKVLYVAFRALYVSRDRGAKWEKLAGLPGSAQKISITGDTVYAIGNDFLTTCRSGQCSSAKTPASFVATSLAQNTFYGISDRDIFVSTDGGASWQKSQLPREGAALSAIAACEHHPTVAYVSYKGLYDAGSRYFGVAKTTDGGHTWDLVWKEKSDPSPNVHDIWLSARFGPSWAGSPLNIGVSPSDPNIVYGTDYGRTMRSTDGGKTWTGVYSTPTPQGTFTTTGLDVTTCYGDRKSTRLNSS